jgi:hypothetical protein
MLFVVAITKNRINPVTKPDPVCIVAYRAVVRQLPRNKPLYNNSYVEAVAGIQTNVEKLLEVVFSARS